MLLKLLPGHDRLLISSDHEGGNVSALAMKLVGSSLSDPYPIILCRNQRIGWALVRLRKSGDIFLIQSKINLFDASLLNQHAKGYW